MYVGLGLLYVLAYFQYYLRYPGTFDRSRCERFENGAKYYVVTPEFLSLS